MKLQREKLSVRKARIVELAKEQCHRDGECEVDDNAIVSEGNDNGAYVQAWVWVDFDGTDFDKEGNVKLKEPARVTHFASNEQCTWNNSGFALKDSGKERDGRKPSWFDEKYPIDKSRSCGGVPSVTTVGNLLAWLKDQLSYPVRYSISPKDAAKPINLRGVPKIAERILTHVARTLGNSWQLMRFNSHFTLYQHRQPKRYANGVQLYP